MSVFRWNKIIGKDVEFHVQRATKRADNAVPYHGHDFAEVFWIDGGKGRHRVNDRVTPLLPGEIIFIRPGDFHGIEAEKEGVLTITNVAFPLATLRFLRERYFAESSRWFWSKARVPAVVTLEAQAQAEVAQSADRLASEPRERFYVERFLMNLLHRVELMGKRPLPSRSPDWLLNACRRIGEPEYLQQGVQGFVRLAGRCHEHVSRVTQECLGESPSEVVNRARMRYAAGQMEMTERLIIEIAMDCGIGNLSHFYKVFREEFGISPRRYRVARRGLN
ncbi:MAG: AraC family transcriptional regulator [Chthoniobacteraceae bacterium]